MSEWIVCAALRNKDGAIVCGARHYDEVMCRQIETSILNWDDTEQGFINQHGKFLTRSEAWLIAYNNGQIKRHVGGDRKKLFSENLY